MAGIVNANQAQVIKLRQSPNWLLRYKKSPGEIRGFLLGNTFFAQYLRHLSHILLPIPVSEDPSVLALFRTY